jgi:hypothetical protein
MALDGHSNSSFALTIYLLDAPKGFPVPNMRGSSMLSPPDRLRVALHRDALGIYRILGPDEHAQESLWLTVEYVRDESTPRDGSGVIGGVNYRMAVS